MTKILMTACIAALAGGVVVLTIRTPSPASSGRPQGLLAPYSGPIAARTALNNADAGAKSTQVMAQSQHPLIEDTKAIEVWWAPTWRVDVETGREVARGAGATCRASARYTDPSGKAVTTRLVEKETGKATATATDGGFCRFIGQVAARRGTRLVLRVWMEAPGGMFYLQQAADYTNGDILRYGAQTPDLTGMSEPFSDTWRGNRDVILPALIIGRTRRHTVTIIGDSRDVGIRDEADDRWGCIGGIARLLCRSVAVTNLSTAGLTAAAFADADYSKRRRDLAAYSSDIAIGLGVNDTIAQGREAANVLADLQAITAALGKPAFYKTINPWVVPGNTGIYSRDNDAKRQALNAALRLKPTFDVAAAMETPGHLFRDKAYVSDGVHETNVGNAFGAEHARFDWSVLGRPVPLTAVE